MRDIFSLMFPVCSKLFRENTPVNNGVVAFSLCLSGYCFVLKYNWQHLPIHTPLVQLMKDTAIIYFSQGWSLSLGNLSRKRQKLSCNYHYCTYHLFLYPNRKQAGISPNLCWVRLQSDVLLLGTDRWEDHQERLRHQPQSSSFFMATFSMHR